jgi:type VI secretion system protein ImpF
MAKTLGDISITLSVLDRLIDTVPGDQFEVPLSRPQSVRLLKSAVRRDLEWLLNTRRIFQIPDDSLKELNRSVYVYGLPDFSSYVMALASDRSKLIRQILAAINLFEPRLANVRLSMIESDDIAKKDIRLRIEAMLRMDPVPEPISFDTVIELKTGNCRITGGEHA